MTVKENWKSYVSKPSDIVDIIRYFVDDYEECKEIYDVNECGIDDATWVHIDSVREERVELELKIKELGDALHHRNNEYNELYTKFRQLEKQVKTGKKPVKKLGKKKKDAFSKFMDSREDVIRGFAELDDDDLPF